MGLNMDTLITILIVIGIIVSIIKSVAKNLPEASTSDSESGYDYEDEDYDDDDYDYDDEELELELEEMPQSIKELWNKFQTPKTMSGGPPPPIPTKKTIVHEPIVNEPIKYETMGQGKIDHKRTSSDFKEPFHHKSIESIDDSDAYEFKVKVRNELLKSSVLRKAVVWSEILAKPVSMRD